MSALEDRDRRDKYRTILLFGPPGAGKGTIGRFLGIAGHHIHLSSGDIFRGLDPDSPAGSIYHSYASRGNLVPDEVTIQVWHQYVQGLIATNRYSPKKQLLLLDGIPRTTNQARELDGYIEVVKVLVLQMPDIDRLVARMKKRAMLEKRQDDTNEDVLKNRLRVYEKETLALLGHYPKESLVFLNADQKPLEVLRDALVQLASLL